MKVKFEVTKAHQKYLNSEGVQVPGVTTILDVTIPKPQLLSWAYNCGVRGKDFRKVKSKAGDIGTIAHWLIELRLKELEPDTSEFSPADLEKATNAVKKFMAWWENGKFQFIASEKQYVSDDGFGGTLDLLALQNNELCLIDLKTSKGIYESHYFQLAGYWDLHEQNYPFDMELSKYGSIKRFIICRIGKEKEESDFEIQEKQSLSWELEVFRACLNLYKKLKAKEK